MALGTVKWMSALLVWAAIAPNQLSAAEFFAETSLDGEPRINIFLDGPIEQGDATKFRAFTQAATDEGKLIESLILSSPGGSLVDGMEIGRITRELRIHATSIKTNERCLYSSMLPSQMSSTRAAADRGDCSCASACALAWLGGVTRGGVTEVHRAYLNDGASLSYSELGSALDSAYAEVEEYLREMRVPPQVYDNFLKTSSAQLTEINDNDVGGDPIWQEFLLSHCVDTSVPPNILSEFNNLHMYFMMENITGKPMNPSDRAKYDSLKGPVITYKACLNDAADIARMDAQHHDMVCQQKNAGLPVYQKICR